MPQWGFGMPPPGFDQLIAQKYSMEQQRTNAAVAAQTAQAQLDTTRANLLPSESAATTGETLARTRGLNITNQFLPDQLKANIFDTNARGLGSIGSYDLEEQQAKTQRGLNTPMSAFNLGLMQ